MNTQDDQIEVVKLNSDDWVIYDRRQEQISGCGVVGHVMLVAGVYELLQLSALTEPQFFATLHEAVDVFTVAEAVA